MAVETMSVRNMGRMLGLKKVESYWLVHKEWFETILVNGKMRVVTESFEAWYNGQYHYRKVEGPPPSCGLMSVRQMAKMLGLADATAYAIAQRGYFESPLIDGKRVVRVDSFEEWYKTQNRYVKKTPDKNMSQPGKKTDSAKRTAARRKSSHQSENEATPACEEEKDFEKIFENRLKQIQKNNRSGRR